MLIAGPNLTIDRTLALAELRPGEVLRFDDVVVTPGGKGVNVARTALALGAPGVLVGFVPGRTGAASAAMLSDEGVELAPVPVGGEIRSTAVIFERSGRVTVMNEPGPAIDPTDWGRFEDAVAQRAGAHGVLACSGSLPPGAPDDAYARLAARAREAGALAIVDVGGRHLAAAVDGGADVVTPNLAEAEGLLHGRADETVDAVVGGLGVALERGEPFARAAQLGLAAGAASVETATAGRLDARRAAALAAVARTG